MRKIANKELGRPTLEEYREIDKLPVVVVLDDVRSLHNVGSFFRTCDAFAMQKIVLTGITGTPPHNEIRKTALGAEKSVEWDYCEDVVEALKQLSAEGYRTIAIEQVVGATKLGDYACERGAKYALVFGNEVFGVSQKAVDSCDQAIVIPQQGTKHSLNVAVCGGVVLWHFYSALSLATKG